MRLTTSSLPARSVFVVGLFLGTAAAIQAQSTDAPQQTAPAATPAPVWSIGTIDFSGLVDGYYSYNFNHPADRYNDLYNFDVRAQEFSLNMAKLGLSHSPDPVGFEVDLGFGRAFDLIHSSEQAPEIFRYLEQAYISLKPTRLKGLEVDFGEFTSSAGAEVIETMNNFNYSRSLLFAWAVPYYHFGLRTSLPLGKHFTAGVQLVNGWNNIEDNNSGKTIGLNGTVTFGKWSLAENYYGGPEHADTNRGWRHLSDTVLTVTPNGRTSAYLNYDYGRDKNIGPGAVHWAGIGGAARFQVTQRIAVSPRVEYFDDHDGFATGTAQRVREVTLTGEYKWVEGLMSRLEYRRDWSDEPFFTAGSGGLSKTQSTLTVAMLGYFGPKR